MFFFGKRTFVLYQCVIDSQPNALSHILGKWFTMNMSFPRYSFIISITNSLKMFEQGLILMFVESKKLLINSDTKKEVTRENQISL